MAEGATVEEIVANAELRQSLAGISPAVRYQESAVALLNPNVRAVGVLLPTRLDRAIPTERQSTSRSCSSGRRSSPTGLLVVLFALAYVGFLRQELRA